MPLVALPKRRGAGFKYHFCFHVQSVVLREGVSVPPDATLRVVWKRGDKAASTRELPPGSGRLEYDEGMSMVCTMYRETAAATGAYATKEATFSLMQSRSAAGHKGHQRPLARLTLDLAPYARVDSVSEDLKLVLLHDSVPVGDMLVKLSSRWLKSFSRSGESEARRLS